MGNVSGILDYTVVLALIIAWMVTIEWNLGQADSRNTKQYMDKCLQYRTSRQCLNMLGLLGLGTNYFPNYSPLYAQRAI